jgi:glucose/arabinose dehydrogenase
MRRIATLLCVVGILTACSGDDAGDTLQPTAAPATSTTSDGVGTDVPESSTTTPDTAPETTPDTTGAGGTSSEPSTTTTSTTTTTAAPLVPLDELQLALEVIGDGFDQPVFLTSPPGDSRRFIVDQPGRIWTMEGDGVDPEVFLDIRDAVRFEGEQGLLGLAFPPDHGDTGRYYVNYTANDGATTVSEFVGSDAGTERVLLRVDQPASNHNGGMLAFGPDGMLWIGMGDGGGSDDRFENAQDPTTLLGSMLRIDPTTDPYATPADNPGPPFAPEIWGIGLRNPWRFSFDGDDLWIGDVGQNAIEEINRLDLAATRPGVNFGWPLFEGSDCYLAAQCDDTGLTRPVQEYGHEDGCSVTGGYVYRGAAIPELTAHYFLGDYCSGWIRGITPEGEVMEWFTAGTVTGLSSFGVDSAGELYVMSTSGVVYRIIRG